MTFGSYLKERRTFSSMRREDLARAVRCSVEHVRRIELGDSRPSPDLLEKMLAALDLTPKEETRLWLLLAESHLPDKIRQVVEVHPSGVAARAAEAAVEWVEMNLELPEGEEPFFRAHVEQRMKP